ncbi:unnamed protein product [Camellia sinensis]
MYVFSSFVRMWGIARQKLGAGGFPVQILEQSLQRIQQPAVSVLRCYSSATKEVVVDYVHRVVVQFFHFSLMLIWLFRYVRINFIS